MEVDQKTEEIYRIRINIKYNKNMKPTEKKTLVKEYEP